MTVKMHKEPYESITVKKTEQVYNKFLKMAYLQGLVRVEDPIVPMPQFKKNLTEIQLKKLTEVDRDVLMRSVP